MQALFHIYLGLLLKDDDWALGLLNSGTQTIRPLQHGPFSSLNNCQMEASFLLGFLKDVWCFVLFANQLPCSLAWALQFRA